MRYNDSGSSGGPLVMIHAAAFTHWFVPFDREPAVTDLRRIRVTRTGHADPARTVPMSIADRRRVRRAVASLGDRASPGARALHRRQAAGGPPKRQRSADPNRRSAPRPPARSIVPRSWPREEFC